VGAAAPRAGETTPDAATPEAVSTDSDESESAALVSSPPAPSDGPAQALPSSSPDTILTGVKKFLVGVAPGGLMLLGAVALFGSGSFLESLRTLRS
jgi:hypothetical protein